MTMTITMATTMIMITPTGPARVALLARAAFAARRNAPDAPLPRP